MCARSDATSGAEQPAQRSHTRYVGERVESVVVVDADGEVRELDNGGCGFGYRTSRMRREPDRFVVLELVMRLTRQ